MMDQGWCSDAIDAYGHCHLVAPEQVKMCSAGSSLFILPATTRVVDGGIVVKDKILCFVCAVKNIETTFNTYYELQDHLYKDHDMKKDPAMEIFNKYRSTAVQNESSASQQ